MEHDYRHLQPVKLDIIGTETGRQRYLKDGWLSLPKTADWRNNLTACSQRHNLYFVAHRDIVAVFQPSFPLQTLGHQPQLKIVPSLANSNAQGYMSPYHPHSINQLIVGDLGSEETLLLCTDSGNVAAYYTASIQDGIDKEPYNFSKEGRSDLVGIRPFFIHWVHESAWGLSIHKHARMLAISSNTPEHVPSVGFNAAITIFAFALTNSSELPIQASKDDITYVEEDESEWKVWVPDAANPTMLPDRSLNWKTRLDAHRHNIPSVAFVNTEEDRDGVYVLSTDIRGITKCWHIWQGHATSTWNFSPAMRRSSNPYHNSPQTMRGWTVLPLDPSSFQVVNTFEEFCGEPNKCEIAAGCLDITNSLCRVPGHDKSVAPNSNNDSAGSESTDEGSDSADHFDVTDSDEEYHSIIAAGIELETASSHSTEIDSIDANVPSSSEERSPIEDDRHSEIETEEESATSNSVRVDSRLMAHEILSATWPHFVIAGDYNSSESSDIQAGSDGAKKMKLRHAGSLSATQQPLQRSLGPVVPTLHLSASHLRVFNPNTPNQVSVYCSDILDFQWPMYYAISQHIDRLNMTQYIPELGIVVIATQIGRAAVCSLTKNGSKGPYGLRVDWILPFQAQEKNGERPFAPLLGIAVGPVQGHQLWRASSVSKDDEDPEEPWLRDRVDKDGVPITFDPEIVRLRRSSSSSSTGTDKDSKFPPAKRYKPSERHIKHRQTPFPNSRLARQAWPSRSEVKEGVTAVMDESWRGLEYSRHYRLMLTYADHSVMTYELSREAPFVGDPTAGRPNWRNRDVFW